jgi:hypothetical protein
MSIDLAHANVIDLALLPVSIHSPDEVIYIPYPTVHSFDMVDFISAECPEQVGKEDVCYLKNEMVKVNFC